MAKAKISTIWLEGCSGCHMSFLDLDEGLLDILSAVELMVTPITDFKDYAFPEAELGIVEGAVANDEQVEVIHKLRGKCKLLMAWGDCAVFGGINAMRNGIPVERLLEMGYMETASSINGVVPGGPDIPALLPKVRAAGDVVPVDVFVPGCPPSPECIRYAIKEILQGRVPKIPAGMLHFD